MKGRETPIGEGRKVVFKIKKETPTQLQSLENLKLASLAMAKHNQELKLSPPGSRAQKNPSILISSLQIQQIGSRERKEVKQSSRSLQKSYSQGQSSINKKQRSLNASMVSEEKEKSRDRVGNGNKDQVQKAEFRVESRNSNLEKINSSSRKIDDLDQKRRISHQKQFSDLNRIDQKLNFKKKKFLDDQLQNQLKSYFNDSYQKLIFPEIDAEKLKLKQLEEERKAFERVKKPPLKKNSSALKAPLIKQESNLKQRKEKKVTNHLNLTLPQKLNLPKVQPSQTSKNQRNKISIGLISEPSLDHQRESSLQNSPRDGSLDKIMNLPLTQQFYKIKSEKKGQSMSRLESQEREYRLKTYLKKPSAKEQQVEVDIKQQQQQNYQSQSLPYYQDIEEKEGEEEPFEQLIQNIFKESPLYSLIQRQIRQEYQFAQSFNKGLKLEEYQQEIFDKQKENLWTNPFSDCPQLGKDMIEKHKEVYQSKIDNLALQKVIEEIFKGGKHSSLKKGQDFTKYFVQKYFKGVDFEQVFEARNRMKEGSLVSARRDYTKEVDINTVFSLDKIEEYKDMIQQLLLIEEGDTENAKTFLTEAGKNYNQFDSIPSKLMAEFVTEGKILQEEVKEFKCEQKDKILTDFKENQEDERRRFKQDNILIMRKEKEKKKFIHQLVSKIDKASSRLQKESQELLRGEDENSITKQQTLYLAFLEIVRQISVTNKSQSLFMIQIWHRYFDQQETKISDIVQKMCMETDSLQNSMKNIHQKLESFIQKRTQNNQKFVQIKSEYEKTLQVLKMSSQLLHIEELQTRQLSKDLNDLHRYTKRVFPRFEGYLTNTDFQIKLMDLPDSLPIDENFYLKYDEYFNLFEAQLHTDIERVFKALKMKSKNKIRLERAENNLKIVKGKLRKEEKSHSITQEELKRLKDKFQKEYKIATDRIIELEDLLTNEIAKNNTARQLKVVEDEKKREAKTIQTQTDVIDVDFMAQQLAKHQIDLKKLMKLKDKAGKRRPQKLIQNQSRNTTQSPEMRTNQPVGMANTLSPEEKRAMKSQPVKPLAKDQDVQDALELELNYQEELAETGYQMREIIVKVRSGQSEGIDKSELKSKKKVLQLIASFMKTCIQNWERQKKEGKNKITGGVDFIFFEYLSRQYGLDRLALRHLEANLVSIEKFKGQDSRIDLMRKFIGLDYDTLPYSIFEAYIKMVVKSNINQQNLFQNDISTFFIDFYAARSVYRELFQRGTALTNQQMMTGQLKKFTKISCSNSWIQDIANLNDCLCFRDLYDKIILLKSKLTSETFLPLFRNRETINLQQLQNFIIIEFKFESINLRSMLKNVIVAANGLSDEFLEKDQVVNAFRQKIEFQIPFAAFTHIGINGVVEHQNLENQELEQVFIFYIDQLGFFDEGSFFQGMDQMPFLAFLQDTGFKMPISEKKLMYDRQCAVNNSEKLSCDDFIDMVRKHNLIPNQKYFEKRKEMRLRKGQKIPEVVEPEQSQDEEVREGLNQDLPKTPTPGLQLPNKEDLKRISMLPSAIDSPKKLLQDPKNSTQSLLQLKKVKSVEVKKEKEEISSVFFQDDKEKLMQGLATSHYGGNSEKYFQDLGQQLIEETKQKGRIKSSKQIVQEARMKLSRLSFPKNIGNHQPSAMQLSRRIKKLDDSQLQSVQTLSRQHTIKKEESSEPKGLGRTQSKIVSFQGDL